MSEAVSETHVPGVPAICENAKAARYRPRDSLCRRRHEEKAQRDRKWKKEMQALEAILELKVANELAEFAGEFFDLVERRSSLPSGATVPFDDGDRRSGGNIRLTLPA
ncbi:hypothetical protein HAV15_006252 [Penicillium sp. str. |nr:hypothetical protein HAV15_006252 [Penicillium sp. str. \